MSIFAVTSGKGGVGKSCIGAYMGAAFAQAGKKVLLVEMGFGYRSLDLILGAQEEILFDISDILNGRCDPAKAVMKTPYHKNLFLLPGPFSPYTDPPDRDLMASVLAGCAANFDIVIADGVDFRFVSPSLFETIILVLTPDSLSVRAAAQHARELYAANVANLRLIINAAPVKVMPMYGVADFDDIIDLVGAQLLGVIPHSPILQYSSNNAIPLSDDTLTAEIFGRITARLMGKHQKLLVQ